MQYAIHSIRRLATMAAILSLLLGGIGCARWQREQLNLDRYRDDRAVDIDQRLSSETPVAKSPF